MKKIIGILLMSYILIGCGRSEAPELDLPVRPVHFVQVAGGDGYQGREFSGTLVPRVITDLSFRVSGTLIRRQAELGDNVNEGDVLAELDPTDYQLNFNRATAAYRNAKTVHERNQTLVSRNSISRAEFERTRSEFEMREAEMEIARLQLSYTRLIAPAQGEIAEVNAEINQVVQQGRTIFVLTEPDQMEIEFTASDVDINRIKLGQKVEARVVATGEILNAEISNIGPSSTAFGRTFPIRARLLTLPERSRSGMTLSLRVNFYTGRGTYMVPGISVTVDRENNYIVNVVANIKDENDQRIGTIEKRQVRLGEIVGSNIQVLEGLNSGDIVVTDGATQVIEGQRVRLRERGSRL